MSYALMPSKRGQDVISHFGLNPCALLHQWCKVTVFVCRIEALYYIIYGKTPQFYLLHVILMYYLLHKHLSSVENMYMLYNYMCILYRYVCVYVCLYMYTCIKSRY